MVTKTTRLFVLLVLVAVCAAVETSEPGLAEAGGKSDAIVVYPNATDVHFSKYGLADQVTYRVRAKFPATPVIDWISQKLREAGWKPLTNDFLNPDLPSSLMRSWQDGLLAPKKPWVCVHQWIGDWEDRSGDIVNYAFRYKEPPSPEVQCSSHASTDLAVFAVYYPKDAVRKMLKAIEQSGKGQVK
jgi:hypothetical protein